MPVFKKFTSQPAVTPKVPGMPKVFNKHHKNAPADAVYVGRPTKWGNPFSHKDSVLTKVLVPNRGQAVALFRELIAGNKDLQAEIRLELRGKDLVCWCAPLDCHADVLLEYANANTDGVAVDDN